VKGHETVSLSSEAQVNTALQALYFASSRTVCIAASWWETSWCHL